MSVRTVLVTGMVVVTLLAAGIIGTLGVVSIGASVRTEAQQRVDHDLEVVASQFAGELDLLGRALEASAEGVDPGSPDLAARLVAIRRSLRLSVVNLCDAQGTPVSGSYPNRTTSVPLSRDPVLRPALEGHATTGTVLFGPERLELEGGAALVSAAEIPSPEPEGEIVTRDALLWWSAVPISADGGKVTHILYGGRLLNHEHDTVDALRSAVFTGDLHDGKPLGTVTIFLRGIRVATNVLLDDGRRAVGTRVSGPVEERVLGAGRPYRGEAVVVGERYLTGYAPLQDPDGRTIGMLYAGLLTDPYRAYRTQLTLRFLVPALAVTALAVLAALVIVRRISRPLQRLSAAARSVSGGEWNQCLVTRDSFAEFENLGTVFNEMLQALRERDERLRRQNDELGETNERLEEANRNYMQMLGFVTHELKSPLAAMQMTINTVVDGYLGEVPEKLTTPLVRIRRNCEELQDMVKNYLDLSRAERGELAANRVPCDFRSEVVDPGVEQCQELFRSRSIELEVDCPGDLRPVVDPELMKIALSNYLTNAAKYGREGGKAILTVREEDGSLRVSVWNEGDGFTREEGEKLFGKFSRLRNAATRGKRGSGLGLFLTRSIAELHGGEAEAESEPGHWARFSLTLPASVEPSGEAVP